MLFPISASAYAVTYRQIEGSTRYIEARCHAAAGCGIFGNNYFLLSGLRIRIRMNSYFGKPDLLWAVGDAHSVGLGAENKTAEAL